MNLHLGSTCPKIPGDGFESSLAAAKVRKVQRRAVKKLRKLGGWPGLSGAGKQERGGAEKLPVSIPFAPRSKPTDKRVFLFRRWPRRTVTCDRTRNVYDFSRLNFRCTRVADFAGFSDAARESRVPWKRRTAICIRRVFACRFASVLSHPSRITLPAGVDEKKISATHFYRVE